MCLVSKTSHNVVILAVQAERRPVQQLCADSPPTMVSNVVAPRSSTPLTNNPLMNGLLAIAKTEHENQMEREKMIMMGIKKEETASSPMSGMTRPSSTSPTTDYGLKRSGIDVMTVIGLAPSESPSSSGAGSSISEDGPVFNAERCRFELPIPHPPPADLNIQFICETASRLLFLSVHWMKDVRIGIKSDFPHIIITKPTTLEAVMKTKWCDLFVLGLMQCADSVGLPRMLEAMNSHLAACSRVGQLKPDKFEEVNHQINYLLLLVRRFSESKLTPMEYAYLKLISFTANDIPSSACSSETRTINIAACQELYEHVIMMSSSNDDSTSEDNETHMTSTSIVAAVER
uniref:NR LBD domain-containing protein n=1 Tax=Heterorhabditis bacteriophora TaxID=37862 RepID=A0A1I7XR19_HETBA